MAFYDNMPTLTHRYREGAPPVLKEVSFKAGAGNICDLDT
jgi:hypothetical protein